MLKAGNALQVVESFGNYEASVSVFERPKMPDARLFIIEEYKTASFLGDYGAGETVKTFSLLPGEKTTITVKTFKEKTSTQNRAENLMDSFSENSAKDFEKTLQDERQTQKQRHSGQMSASKSVHLAVAVVPIGPIRRLPPARRIPIVCRKP